MLTNRLNLFAQKDLKELKNLDLLNCEVSLTDDFRGRVFQLLEGLAVLDGFDRNNQEAEEDETSEEGIYQCLFNCHY